jgi:hypothetical protein
MWRVLQQVRHSSWAQSGDFSLWTQPGNLNPQIQVGETENRGLGLGVDFSLGDETGKISLGA